MVRTPLRGDPVSRFDPRRYLGDDDTDILGTWDPSGLDEEARVPTGRDDVTEEFVAVADQLGANDQVIDDLRRFRAQPVRSSAEGWSTAPRQTREAVDDWEWPDPGDVLPWWAGPVVILVAFALIAGQIGKLFDFRVR